MKGNSEDFKMAHAKIALLLGRKGEEVKINQIKLKIVDTPYEKGCSKSLIELSSNDIVQGKVVLKNVESC